MFSKIVVRNVGVLKAFDTPSSPRLAKLTLFYGRNGRGKSTLTSVLRAARDGCSSTVLARRSLGTGGAAPEVTLVSPAGNVRFANGSWNARSAAIEVFDTAFITDNVCAGELVDLAHDRGLFSIIIGRNGVRLAEHLERFNAIVKASAAKLKSAEAAVAEDLPADLKQDEFFALPANADYRERLAEAERGLTAVRQAGRMAMLRPLQELATPGLPPSIEAVLDSTVSAVDVTARARLLDHFRRFHLDRTAEAWVAYGVEHVQDDACPFCGRDGVDDAGVLTLYGQIFGDAYKSHLATITGVAAELEKSLGGEARSVVSSTVAENSDAGRQWSNFVKLDRDPPDVPQLDRHLTAAHKIARELLETKRSAPLDKAGGGTALEEARAELAAATALIGDYNSAVELINEAIGKTTAAAPASLATATQAREDVERRMRRHEIGVQGRIDALLAARKRDRRAKDVRTTVQKRLKKANEDAAEHYHRQVNHYLARFGASFAISKITNSMQGNSGQADYGLLIKGETVARQRGRVADAMPTFRNTLSSGDKTTLAFAFFLAKLDHDQDLCRKTLVIDDPLSSHDSHRRRMTVEAIKELSGRCLQVIVLSHDEFLLREVERRCAGVDSAAFQIDFDGADEWSAATAVNLVALCQAGHAKLVGEIAAFIDRREGAPDDVVLKLRQVLETHFRRSFTAYFAHDQNLGQIVKEIASAGTSHPCHAHLTRLDACNAATCEKHHGDDAVVVARRGVDPDELKVVARDALELIGARRPS